MQNTLISSFGRRKARKLRVTSQKAYDESLPLVKLVLGQKIFPHEPSDIWLEIGFGGGEHMRAQLAQNPHIAMIGCEPFMNGVAQFLTHLLPEDISRVRIWHEDVRLLLDAIPSSFFAGVFILFPDPWPKKRHHIRRLITQAFMAKLLPTLKEGAFLKVASDDSAYVEHIQKVLYDHSELQLCLGPESANPLTWEGRPEGWPSTRYEQKAVAQGKNCAYMIFKKKRIS
jgi:tRNA (guanine-N7-)-methyltransferase